VHDAHSAQYECSVYTALQALKLTSVVGALPLQHCVQYTAQGDSIYTDMLVAVTTISISDKLYRIQTNVCLENACILL
jgi:hypothetical protein